MRVIQYTAPWFAPTLSGSVLVNTIEKLTLRFPGILDSSIYASSLVLLAGNLLCRYPLSGQTRDTMLAERSATKSLLRSPRHNPSTRVSNPISSSSKRAPGPTRPSMCA